MKTITAFLQKHKLSLIGVLLGTLGGYIYYAQWGCLEGCTITGSPVNSSLYGALMGGLFFNLWEKPQKHEK